MNLSRFLIVMALGCFLIPNLAVAQDESVVESMDVEVVEAQGEGGAPIVISATQTSDGNGGTAMRIMSAEMTGDAMPMLFAGDKMAMNFGMGAPDQLNLLQKPSV